MLIKLDRLRLSHCGVKLVRAVVARTENDAVVGHFIQKPCLWD